MKTVTPRMLQPTHDAKVRILRAGVVEHLTRGTMKRAREAAECLARLAPSRTLLRLARGRAEKVLVEIPVRDVNEAASIWSAYRDARGFGASTAPRALIVVDGVQRGYVSYNGRVWKGHPTDPHDRANLIYDPADPQTA